MSFDLTTKQLDLKARARDLAAGIIAKNAAEVDKSEQYPWENVKALKEAGFMGMTIPTELGGPGLNFLDANLVVEEMASYCGPTGRIAVEANMGGNICSGPLRYRNPETFGSRLGFRWG